MSPYYDEVLHEVASSIQARGSLGKAGIGALVFWKRINASARWAARLHAVPDAVVRMATARAIELVTDRTLSLEDAARAGREALLELPGFASGPALASAVLTAAAPQRMAVYDRRVVEGFKTLGVPLTPVGVYSGYMARLDALLADAPAGPARSWVPRDLDLALFTLGGKGG
ncbi:hypothetical protein [Cellulomonas sp. APG4]|uniref:hypothetical protein n=1 Tax=Cellulomonas sp. APG4 TaxID=1538656 RepID=UPI00192A3EB9|nr:hypothetical protein [Cellulomonas sp. APG4]